MTGMAIKSVDSDNERSDEIDAAFELVRLAKQQELVLTGPGGLLKQLTKTMLETALDEEMSEWSSRPLDAMYVANPIDVIVMKVRERQVANRAFYAAIGVGLEGKRDALRHDVKPIYTSATPGAAQSSRDVMLKHWGNKHPAIKGL
jgi:transposase-like protein